MKLAPAFILFCIIVVEGYIVLSSELLAIRQTTPFVGSGTDTVSIIIAAVLMPLAVGYYAGGYYSSRYPANQKNNSIRRKLLRNIFISSVFLVLGLSTWTVNLFFLALNELGLTHRLLMTTLYSVLFLLTPVYLLGQTVPLVSNYFSKQVLSRITGKMLFFSTVGSFLGAIFSTLIMMSFFGVHHTVTLTFVLLTAIAMTIGRFKQSSETIILMIALTIGAGVINSDAAMKKLNIVSNNQYNTIQVYTDSDGAKTFVQNNNSSSAIHPDGRKHAYIEETQKHFLTPLMAEGVPAKNILVIGAGGFTFGLEDTKNTYVFVDIDPSLEQVAVKDFLDKPLTANKKFVPVAAQGYLASDKTSYDLIFLDVYNGDTTIPEDLVTVEFYQSVRDHLNEGGILVMNFILSPTFEDKMSRHLDDTLRSVFPHLGRQIVGNFDGWVRDPNKRENIMYYYRKTDPVIQDRVIYTRDKNAIFFDKPQQHR